MVFLFNKLPQNAIKTRSRTQTAMEIPLNIGTLGSAYQGKLEATGSHRTGVWG